MYSLFDGSFTTVCANVSSFSSTLWPEEKSDCVVSVSNMRLEEKLLTTLELDLKSIAVAGKFIN